MSQYNNCVAQSVTVDLYCRLNVPFETENKLEKIKFKDMSHANRHRFHDMLEDTDWNRELHGITNTNDQVSKLQTVISNYYNLCFPMKV